MNARKAIHRRHDSPAPRLTGAIVTIGRFLRDKKRGLNPGKILYAG